MKTENLDDRVRRIKARWLRRVMYESAATSTEKCLAYAIADHLNCVTLDCWPAQATLATLLGSRSLKTVQRSARGLEASELITIRPRVDGKPGYRYAPTFLSIDTDKPDRRTRHSRPELPDINVEESSSDIQDRSSSTSSSDKRDGQGRRTPTFNRNQRGTIEVAIADLLGPRGLELLSRLSSLDDRIIDRLCSAYVEGALGRRELAAARLAAEQAPSSESQTSARLCRETDRSRVFR